VIGLDTNVLARYYVASADAPGKRQSLAAKQLIESGKRLLVSKTVVLELEWVLRGYYKTPPAEVEAVYAHLLSLPNVEVEDRPAVELAVAALTQGFDFADALHHASYRQCNSVATFDARSFAWRAQAASWKPRVDLLKHSAP
jgi:predicted nucleic-acid-binding protein